MQLTINVDDSMFKNVLEKELEAFSKEELHDIIRDCFVELLKDDNILKDLIYKEEVSGYYGSTKKVPSEIMIEAAEKIDLHPAFEEIQDKMINTIKENHRDIVEKVLLNLMIDGIVTNNNFRNNMTDAIQIIVHEAMHNIK